MNEILQLMEQLGREKSLSRDVIIEALEEAMVMAAKSVLKTEENLIGHFNPEKGMVELYKVMEVVDDDLENLNEKTQIKKSVAEAITGETWNVGDRIEFIYETDTPLTRIAAKSAKEVLTKKIKTAERTNIYNEYKDKIGKIINGIVKRKEGKNIIVDIGRTEAVIPPGEQVKKNENFQNGERIRALLVEVKDPLKEGYQLVLSRTRPEFVEQLFYMEVPEVYDGSVIIKGVARDPGERTKIAVMARDKDIDPIGACIGMRGQRVQAVMRELRGEKIDVISYKEDIAEYVKAALAPAVITRVEIIDPVQKKMEIIVADEQLSLCIGKKGQNVKLASDLVGWTLTVKSESAKKQELMELIKTITKEESKEKEIKIEGIPESILNSLREKELLSKEKISSLIDEELLKIPEMKIEYIEILRKWAKE